MFTGHQKFKIFNGHQKFKNYMQKNTKWLKTVTSKSNSSLIKVEQLINDENHPQTHL